MTTRPSLELLKRLSEAPGPPGCEGAVRRIVREALPAECRVEHDRLGSVVAELDGDAAEPRVVLDAHLDEVGFMVQSVGDDGGIAFVALGGWWGHVLLGQRVELLIDDGERRVAGVVGATPPHFLGPEERARVQSIETMSIDVGASSREEVEQLGIRVGDPIVPLSTFGELGRAGRYVGKALDDRLGVVLMCELMRHFEKEQHPNTLVGVGAVQEEVGLRGAQTATALARPDVAIVLESTPADDAPSGVSQQQGALGKGPQLRLFDPKAIPNRRLVRFVESRAKALELPLQLAVRRSGGTDAGSIHRVGAGVPVCVVGVPTRYIHTHAAIVDGDDLQATFRLLADVVARLDRETVASFTAFD